MSFLADENFPGAAVAALRSAGFDVLWIAETKAGAHDDQVLQLCNSTGRTLLTFDKDFGELAYKRGLPAQYGVVLFRIIFRDPEEIAGLSISAIRAQPDWTGCFGVVTRRGIRIRAVPSHTPRT